MSHTGPARRVQSCSFTLGQYTGCTLHRTISVLHRPHAFRPHLAASGRGAKLLKHAKHSPESSPCPRAVMQTPRATKIAKSPRRNSNSRLRTFKTGPFPRSENMFSRSPQGGLTNLAAYLTPRRPTCIFTRNLQVISALALRHPRVFKHSGGLPGHTADRPGATSAPTWPAAASTRGSVGLAAAPT